MMFAGGLVTMLTIEVLIVVNNDRYHTPHRLDYKRLYTVVLTMIINMYREVQ